MRARAYLSCLSILWASCLVGCLDASDGPDEEAPISPPEEDASTGPPGLALVAGGFSAPILATHAGDDSGRLFVVEQGGAIHVIGPDGAVRPWADLTGLVGQQGGEQGLLGVAFHPDHGSNGVVIVSYTDAGGSSVLSRFHASSDGIDGATEEVLLTVAQPFGNHNGGHIEYGPDGYLYVGLGDGGLAGDPNLNGQNKATLLGAILRLDVAATGPYAVPEDNPFVGDPTGADETWVYGLRNPWRFHFAPDGALWIGDVGQDAWEEVNRIAPDEGGANLGWNLYEGNHQYPTGIEAALPIPGLTFPVAEFAQGPHCSVTMGVPWEGSMLVSDFCSGFVWSAGGDGRFDLLFESGKAVSSFGTGEDGAAYLLAYGEGAVYRLLP